MVVKRGYYRSLAVFLSILIITLPFYSAMAFASLDITYAGGSKGIDGYIQENDVIDIEALASIGPDNDINKEQVLINSVPTTPFDSCSAGLDGSVCKLKYPASGTSDFGNTFSFKVILNNDAGSQENEAPMVLYTDKLPPKVESFSILIQTDGSIGLSYSVEDSASAVGDGRCSGISKIEFHKDSLSGTVLKAENIDTSSCHSEGQAAYSYTGTGVLKICAKAYDQFNQASTQEICDEIDATKPTISKIEIIGQDGLPLNYIGQDDIYAAVQVNLSPESLNQDTLRANFSLLGLGQDVPPASVEVIGENIVARWEGIILSPSKKDVKFTIRAASPANFITSQSFQKTLKEDSTSPVVTSLGTDKSYNGQSYGKPSGTNFIATIREAESGLTPSNVKLNIVGGSIVSAAECSSGWTCRWNNILLPNSQKVKVSIGTGSQDNVGNYFNSTFTTNVSIDNIPPVINESNIEITSSHPLGYVAVGYEVLVTAEITDTSPEIEAYADLSEAVSSMDNATGECSKSNSTFTCVWSGEVDADSKNATIKIKAYDFVGNSAEATKSFMIYGVLEGTPDFFDLTIDEQYITAIDKMVADHFVGDYIYYTLPFMLKYKGDCTGEVDISNLNLEGTCGDNSYVNYKKIRNDMSGFFQFAINPSLVQLQNESNTGVLEMGKDGCELDFNIICNNNVFSVPENETVQFNIPIIDTLAPDDSMLEEIDKVTEEATSGMNSYIEKLDKIMTILQNICKILGLFGKVQTLLNTVHGLLCICSKLPVIGAFCTPAEKAISTVNGVVGTIQSKIKLSQIQAFCDFINCEGKGIFGWCNKLKDMLFSIIPDNKFIPLPNGDKASYRDLTIATAPSTLELAKKSWIFSIACFCIPGMIYNAKKLQEIKCWKAYCYKKMVPAGLPKEECDKQYAYQMCTYWGGQFTVFLELIMGPIKLIIQMLSDPLALGLWMFDIFYSKQCAIPAKGCIEKLSLLCIPRTVLLIMDFKATLEGITNTLSSMQWEPQMNFCDRLQEDS